MRIFKNKILNNIMAIMFIISSILLITLYIFEVFDLYLIYELPKTIFIIITVILFFYFMFKFTAKIIKPKLKILLRVLLILFVVISILICYLTLLYGSIFQYEVIFYKSPENSNKIVVFEGGFFDTSYSAYPVKHSIFYQNQNNIYITQHDFWGQAKIEIDWDNNSAVVYVIFDKQVGRTTTNSIPIYFK